MHASRLVALASVALLAPLATASIVTVSGACTQIGAPIGCNLGQLTGFTAYAWNEQQNKTLSLSVDMLNNPGSSLAPIPGSVNGVYDSHFLHFEPIPGAIGAQGTVTFNNPIVAVIFSNTNLDLSDAPAGAFGTSYPTFYPIRGLSTVPQSWVTINANVLTFDLHTVIPTQFLNQVRVLTQAPAPGSAALLGMAGIACARRRRR